MMAHLSFGRLASAALLAMLAPVALAESFDARLGWVERVGLSPRVSGLVSKVHVVPGDRVPGGAVLVELDRSVYQSRTAAMEADVTRSSAILEDARVNLGRVQELYDRDVAARSELDAANLAVARAEADLQRSRALAAAARDDATDTRLRAPFDALVVARNTEPGDNVVVALRPDPLLVVARAGRMAARFQLPVEQVHKVRPGKAAQVRVADRTYNGTVTNVALEPDADGRGYTTEVVFESSELLRAGQPARVEIEL